MPCDLGGGVCVRCAGYHVTSLLCGSCAWRAVAATHVQPQGRAREPQKSYKCSSETADRDAVSRGFTGPGLVVKCQAGSARNGR